MITSPDALERAERQARIEEDIRRLFARYRRQAETDDAPVRRFVRPKRQHERQPTSPAPPRA